MKHCHKTAQNKRTFAQCVYTLLNENYARRARLRSESNISEEDALKKVQEKLSEFQKKVVRFVKV
jgi:UDP:flavonoid glycosyltransferase YjiC (YdhE family)